jgi:hypothetical protein
VTADHEVRVVLPSDFPTGTAEVIVVIGRRSSTSPRAHVSVDELIAGRLTPPPGTPPVTLADMERAIADGARESGVV